MSVQVPARVRDLLARAGLGGLSDQAALAVCVVCGAAVVLAAWRFWPQSRAEELAPIPGDVGASIETSATTDGPGAAGGSSDALVVVHVVGAVMRPGVYTLAVGSRVADAVAAAGGSTGNAAPNAVNLARVLADGEQVYLPTADEASATAAAGGAGVLAGGIAVAGGATAAGKVDINRATAAELDALPGVGPATAQKIVDDRAANGPFKTIEDLMRVSGIGEKKFDALKDLVTVG
ncbi:MAG: helix-hairpin-helix domain-containing protein [Coriobacteriia bacterium]